MSGPFAVDPTWGNGYHEVTTSDDEPKKLGTVFVHNGKLRRVWVTKRLKVIYWAKFIFGGVE